mmetsp:Transcript_8579/g.31921  ORF Transcript_8579/g.31921 Transcript_8579/m.31921 type:complete len:351 (-) Transcript_8579:145-1197(-)
MSRSRRRQRTLELAERSMHTCVRSIHGEVGACEREARHPPLGQRRAQSSRTPFGTNVYVCQSRRERYRTRAFPRRRSVLVRQRVADRLAALVAQNVRDTSAQRRCVCDGADAAVFSRKRFRKPREVSRARMFRKRRRTHFFQRVRRRKLDAFAVVSRGAKQHAVHAAVGFNFGVFVERVATHRRRLALNAHIIIKQQRHAIIPPSRAMRRIRNAPTPDTNRRRSPRRPARRRLAAHRPPSQSPYRRHRIRPTGRTRRNISHHSRIRCLEQRLERARSGHMKAIIERARDGSMRLFDERLGVHFSKVRLERSRRRSCVRARVRTHSVVILVLVIASRPSASRASSSSSRKR